MQEIGLPVIYDGKKYAILWNGEIKEYPIGGLLCELSRLHPGILKELIDSYPNRDQPNNQENANKGLIWVAERIKNVVPWTVAQAIILGEFSEFHDEYSNASEKKKNALLELLNKTLFPSENNISSFILEGTGTDRFLDTTVGHYLYSLFAVVANSIITSIALIKKILEDDDDKAIDVIIMLGSQSINMQSIDYKISIIEGEFEPVYTIKNSISLVLFEIQYMLQHDTCPRKCKNCGEYFVPIGRRDARYCTYSSPQNSKRTCKEIGAQATRAKKEKDDVTVREYRRKYMRLKMYERRNPDNKEAAEALETFMKESNLWKERVESGEISKDDYIVWLKQ